MRINSINTHQTDRVNAKKKKGVGDGGLFAGVLSGVNEAEAPAAVSETTALSSLNPMLALQEISDDEVQTKQAFKRGKMTLDALDDLRHSLLMGSLSPHSLEQLARMVRDERQHCNDPLLESILDDIELRAAVELAKLEMAQAKR